MIFEVADIRIAPERSAEFEKEIRRGVATAISGAKGFIDHKIKRGIENPGRYLLIIRWETLESHTKDFRESDAFAQWRAIVGPFFVSPPVVEHFEVLS